MSETIASETVVSAVLDMLTSLRCIGLPPAPATETRLTCNDVFSYQPPFVLTSVRWSDPPIPRLPLLFVDNGIELSYAPLSAGSSHHRETISHHAAYAQPAGSIDRCSSRRCGSPGEGFSIRARLSGANRSLCSISLASFDRPSMRSCRRKRLASSAYAMPPGYQGCGSPF
jgi:hypothetical protein